MKCNMCSMPVEKKWKYCPNCSNKLNNKKIIIIPIILILIVSFCIFEIIETQTPVNESYIKEKLYSKYKEVFTDVYYIQSIENPDIDLNCDGSSFGTIKGKGFKEYYKVYSEKNNINFFVYYDTSDKNKTIYDTYETYLTRRDTILEIYDFTEKILNDSNIKFSILCGNEQPIEIISKSHLKRILSIFNDEYITSGSQSLLDNIYVKINANIFEFSKSNYSIIKNINNEVIKLKYKHYFTMIMIFNNNAKIELNRLDGQPYVYDRFGGNKAWGEKLDDFVLRTEY